MSTAIRIWNYQMAWTNCLFIVLPYTASIHHILHTVILNNSQDETKRKCALWTLDHTVAPWLLNHTATTYYRTLYHTMLRCILMVHLLSTIWNKVFLLPYELGHMTTFKLIHFDAFATNVYWKTYWIISTFATMFLLY